MFFDDFSITADCSRGGVASVRAPISNWQSVASTVVSERRHSLGGKLSCYLPASRTRFIAAYKWTSGSALSPVDEFNASPGQMDTYLSVFLRLYLTATSFFLEKVVGQVVVQ